MALRGSIDAVILAGGQSLRLGGIVPPYHKPFVVIEGRSLLVRAVLQAEATRAQRIVVVTCAEIALPVAQLLERSEVDDTKLHIVLRTGGPGLALREGLELCRADRTLVLMADNVNQTGDITDMVQGSRYAIGIRELPSAEAARFTRFVNHRWVEDRTVDVLTPRTRVWCGPLIIDRAMGLQSLGMTDSLIGPHLDYLAPDGSLTQYEVDSHDIGTPEALADFTRGVKK